MGIQFNISTTISDKFRAFTQNGNYESFILHLMNSSKILLPNKYEKVIEQSKGECDFIDQETGEKFDAKLPFTKEQGRFVGSRNFNFENWLQSIHDEISEYGEYYIKSRGTYDVKKLQLYTIINKLISKDKPDENIIIFFPFFVVYESSVGIYGQFASNILSVIFNELNNEGLIKNRKIYSIYPSIDNMIVLRCLNNNTREFFPTSELDQFISFNVSITKPEA